MENNPKFKLMHTLLYAKNWYKSEVYEFRHNTNEHRVIWCELMAVLKADGYAFCEQKDVLAILINHCEQINANFIQLSSVVKRVTQFNCHMYGYYHKDSPMVHDENYKNTYDFNESLVMYILSNLKFLENSMHDPLPYPDFKNVLPKRESVTHKTVKEFFKKKKSQNQVIINNQ